MNGDPIRFFQYDLTEVPIVVHKSWLPLRIRLFLP